MVADRSNRRRRSVPLLWMLLVAGLIGTAGTAGVLRAANARTDDVVRIDGLNEFLTPVDGDEDADGEPIEYPAENYLLVGSDSRDGADASTADSAVIGDSGDVSGTRSDTIMILRQERNGGAALMSLPRDLWIEIAGTGRSQRINTAFNTDSGGGAERLAATVTQSLGIPVHHYVEVDFFGFKDIIDRIGGVELCVGTAVQDTASGLLLQPGCQTLDGVMALAYARSRNYEEWDGTQWVKDPRADLGRIERQQLFIRAAVDGALRKLQSSPFSSGDMIEAVIDSVRIDDRLDPIKAAEALRAAAEQGLVTYSLPVYNDTVGDASVLRLADGSDDVLAYFRGDAPAPAEYRTDDVTDPDAADPAAAG